MNLSADHLAVYEALLDVQRRGEPAALATIISVEGSVPRHEGSKMLVRADKSIVGTVGGGALESMVVEEALNTIQDGEFRNLNYTLNDLAAGDPGICGGTVQLMVEPVAVWTAVLPIVLPTPTTLGQGSPLHQPHAAPPDWPGVNSLKCPRTRPFPCD